MSKKRVVLLIDMDCFYVQVVQRKNPSLCGKPCAVVQYNTWKGGGIIAVGYEARKFGVTRQMRGNEAKAKCPDINLVHVPENRGKADLTMFRDAGAEVIEVLAEFCDTLERASIDEAYMDLTLVIDKELEKSSLEEVALLTFRCTNIVGFDNMEMKDLPDAEITASPLYRRWLTTLRHSDVNLRLAMGAVVAHRMRTAVIEKLGFSCSGGIGHNKMLSKIVAGFHKPNQQTLVLPDHIPDMFQTTKMRKIRSLGGKVGQQLEDQLNIVHMADLLPYTTVQLEKIVGKKQADIVYGLCRGIDEEPVRPRQLAKSVGCSKNFNGKLMLATKADVNKWLHSLCEEVNERLEKERSTNNRCATLMTVGCVNQAKVSQTRRCNIKTSVDALTEETFRTLSEFNRASNDTDWTPKLINLSLSASKFLNTSTINPSFFAQSARTKPSSDINNNVPTISSDEKPKVASHKVATTSSDHKSSVATSSHLPHSENKQKNPKAFFSSTKTCCGTAENPTHQKQEFTTSDKKSFGEDRFAEVTLPESIFDDELMKLKSKDDKSCLPESRTFDMNEDLKKCGQPKTFVENIIKTDSHSTKYSRDLFLNEYEKLGSFSETSKRCGKITDEGNRAASINNFASNSQFVPNKNEQKENNSENLFSKNLSQPITFGVNRNESDGAKRREKKSVFTNFFNQPNKSSASNQQDNSVMKKPLKPASITSQKSKSLFERFSKPSSKSLNNQPTKCQINSETTSATKRQHDTAETTQPNTKRGTHVDDLTICPTCGKQLLVWDVPDHMDFHYAKDLQDSLKTGFLNLYASNPSKDSGSGPSNPTKKRKSEQSVKNFFSPKNS